MGAGLEHLQQLPLQNMNLYGCDEISDTGLLYLTDVAPLQNLHVPHSITATGLEHFHKHICIPGR